MARTTEEDAGEIERIFNMKMTFYVFNDDDGNRQ
jgi:hypothetical protein